MFCIEKGVFGVFVRLGGDLLSRALRHSTIGAEVFNGRVRNGIGFWALRHSHQVEQAHLFFVNWSFLICLAFALDALFARTLPPVGGALSQDKAFVTPDGITDIGK